MLGKLIKHEWKSTYRMGCLMLFITLLVTFMGWLSFQSPMWRQLREDSYNTSFGPLDFISIIVLLMYVFMLAGISYAILIYLGVHFYRTMYTDQGYLAHTLPVGKHQLLVSKILVNGLWLLIIYVAVFLSGLAVLGSLIGIFLSEGYAWVNFWHDFLEFVSDFAFYFDINDKIYLITMIFNFVLSPFVTVGILFGSITLGQMFARARVLMAILCYLGVGILNNLISSVVQSIVTFSSIRLNTAMTIGINSSQIVQLIAAVALYFASYYILTKKLNME